MGGEREAGSLGVLRLPAESLGRTHCRTKGQWAEHSCVERRRTVLWNESTSCLYVAVCSTTFFTDKHSTTACGLTDRVQSLKSRCESAGPPGPGRMGPGLASSTASASVLLDEGPAHATMTSF
jgi:hypothetical protein